MIIQVLTSTVRYVLYDQCTVQVIPHGRQTVAPRPEPSRTTFSSKRLTRERDVEKTRGVRSSLLQEAEEGFLLGRLGHHWRRDGVLTAKAEERLLHGCGRGRLDNRFLPKAEETLFLGDGREGSLLFVKAEPRRGGLHGCGRRLRSLLTEAEAAEATTLRLAGSRLGFICRDQPALRLHLLLVLLLGHVHSKSAQRLGCVGGAGG
mmetsp:Transcript_15908/g.39073  ORF Transcript_15908/g.39073 Transcript_15908/m.39073 type:complete len:205 (-) Transcript_15908:96-710(-)